MTTVNHASYTQYWSLGLDDTYVGKRLSEGAGLTKVALSIVSIIAIPLELIGRLFYNIALWAIGHNAFHERVRDLERDIEVTRRMIRCRRRNSSLDN